ncbi:hypothetical protein NE237_004498 [Protea cynaroides]|uniref:Uncharacterized protein n=1 Tax=Protea cynaroides TaxID=273540 RepID=A0A9Q0QTR6_9MAGN|nr:hypothetical protein NE237_004498 [Protea cynaroides]
MKRHAVGPVQAFIENKPTLGSSNFAALARCDVIALTPSIDSHLAFSIDLYLAQSGLLQAVITSLDLMKRHEVGPIQAFVENKPTLGFSNFATLARCDVIALTPR